MGHRGSIYGVENTKESIQGAIDAGADYAEIDILLSSDGVPMVIHDTNLKRLTGLDVNVYELTSAKLQELTLHQNGYIGQISTLEEIIKLCDGKIGLAIELKIHEHETENLVEQVMKDVKKYDFLDKCMFISLDYGLIEEINTKYPESLAGYCVYGGVGKIDPDVVMTMSIDFIVIEEAMANSRLVHNFRRSWLPVYVWTVNDPASMQKYLKMGIVGIVSDYPEIAMEEVAYYNNTSNTVYLDEAEWRED